jgi:hypothetical protein
VSQGSRQPADGAGGGPRNSTPCLPPAA